MAATSRKKRTAGQKFAGPVEGSYQISSGIARLISDDYTPDGWVLEINGMESSHLVLDRPRHLDFEYMRWLVAVVETQVETYLDPHSLRITHLGGGACTLARYFVDRYPDSRNTVVEIDAQLAAYVRQWFDLPRAPSLKIRVGEARQTTTGFADRSRDIIIRDVFSGYQTPEDLTTLEFTQLVAKKLDPKGLYIVNCGDDRELAGARAEAAAISQVFAYTCAVADAAMIKGRRRGNIILAGSQVALPLDSDKRAVALSKRLLSGAVPAQYKDDSWLRKFAQGRSARRDSQLGLG